MRDALEAGGFGGNVERRAEDDGSRRVVRSTAGGVFGAVAAAAVVLADAPGGVVGRSGDDADFVTARGEPCGHLTGVLADAGELG